MISQKTREQLHKRLSRIEGQIRGLNRMVEAERPCIEILTQISSVQEALRGVGKIMMRNYLESCATKAIRSQNKKRTEETYKDIMEVIYKFAK